MPHATVDCAATCEVDLSAIWEGAAGDVTAARYALAPTPERADAYPGGSAGEVALTIAAARALRTLRAAVEGDDGME